MKTKAARRRVRVPFKPKSVEYMKGCYDTLDRLATLVYHGPIFLQVLATMAGSDVAVPGVDVHTREQFEKEFKASVKKKPGRPRKAAKKS